MERAQHRELACVTMATKELPVNRVVTETHGALIASCDVTVAHMAPATQKVETVYARSATQDQTVLTHVLIVLVCIVLIRVSARTTPPATMSMASARASLDIMESIATRNVMPQV